jgi:uncharacterized protein
VQFNVSQLLKDSVGSSRCYTIDQAVERLPENGTSQISGALTLVRTDRGVWAKGILTTNAESSCSRCLCNFLHSVQFSLNEICLPTTDVHTGIPIPVVSGDDFSCSIDNKHTLDLHEAVRQYIIINTPMKPLCQSDCLGICQKCGSNLNNVLCVCPDKAKDPKWTVLLEAFAGHN